MGKITVDNSLNEYIKRLSTLTGSEADIIGHGIYEGAKITADAVSAAIDSIPIDTHHGTPDNPLHGINKAQKRGLQDGFGIAKMNKDGDYWNVKSGFNSYNSATSKKYPNGQPNAMIARSLERGTSFSQPIRFFSAATRRVKEAAKLKIQETIEQEFKDIFGG